MKKSLHRPNVLLIRPPFSTPWHPSPGWSRMHMILQELPIAVETNDAAADFFQTMLSRNRMEIATDLAGPWGAIETRRRLDQMLEAVSKAHPPSCFHQSGFAHPGLNTPADLAGFADDCEGNPLRHHALNSWQPFSTGALPDLALLYVGRPGQVGPAATLAAAWKRRWPEIPLYLLERGLVSREIKMWFESTENTGLAPELGGCPAQILAAAKPIVSGLQSDQETDGVEASYRHEHTGRPLVAESMPAVVAAALEQGDKLIVWDAAVDPIETAPVLKQLYAASRQGLWNHLVLRPGAAPQLEAFAAANANIVHSYCHRERALSAFSDPMDIYPAESPGYGRTAPMPGRPLWLVLQDLAMIRTLLADMDPKKLMRLRIRDDGKGMFEVGRNPAYHFMPPGDLPEGHLDEIVKMVEAGGSVNTRYVRSNLERAYLIAYVEEEGVIVGNSSLKHPRDEYIDAVSEQSGLDLHHYLERGYTSVRPEYRGLGVGARLLEGLTERAGEYRIFSVIAETNIATQKMAVRNRTRRVATFFSRRAGKEMSVWIPEWMLPDGFVLPAQPVFGDLRDSGKDNQ